MNSKKYNNYFKNHYKARFTQSDVDNYMEWLTSQLDFIHSKVQIKRSSHVLEIGSGFGGFYNMIKDFNPEYHGIEMDRDAVAFANKFFKKKLFTNISLEKFQTEKKFSYIFAFEVLEHIDDPFNAVNKIYSLLNKKGVFIGTSPYPFKKNVYADKTHRYVLHPSNWEKIFLENGFKKVDTFPMTYLPFVWRINKRFNIRLPFYFPFKHIISTTLIIAYK